MKNIYLGLFLLLMGCWQVGFAEEKSSGKFISLADIHFNPFDDCEESGLPCPIVVQLRGANAEEWPVIFDKMSHTKLARFGQDTNYPLFKSLIKSLNKINQLEKPDFGLIIGDFLAHDFKRKYHYYSGDRSKEGYANFVKKVFQYMTAQIHEQLPHLNIYSVVGNNDSYTGDYGSVPGGAFFRDTTSSFNRLIEDKANRQTLAATFPQAGYYVVTLPLNSKNRIIVLNSVLFSRKAKGQAVHAAALQQLSWLHQQLSYAKKNNQHVLLSFHIPVGIDVYATVKNKLNGIKSFWQPQYNDRFEKELKQFPRVVKEILPGHIHMDAFQLVTVNEVADIPITFTPAISPIFGNNPALKIFNYDLNTFALQNYETFYLPLNGTVTWEWHKEYNFNQAYQPSCKNCSIKSGMQLFISTNELVPVYQRYYDVQGNPIASITAHWQPYYRCNISSINELRYSSCIKRDMIV